MAAALTAGFASFATVAGGFMAGAGILTGNKKLQKLGGFLSLAGGVANAVNGLAEGVSAAGEASSAWDAAGSAAGSDAAQFGKYASDAAAGVGDAAAAATSGSPLGLDQLINSPMSASDGATNLMDSARIARTGMPMAESIQQSPMPTSAPGIGGAPQAIVDAAGQIKSQDHMQQLLTKLKTGASGVGQFAKDNKELLWLGGNVLQSAFGPQAEALDYQKSLMERRRQNLNTPIRMTVGGT